MSAPTSCLPCNPQVTTTNVPGSTGASAITVTTASFVLPAEGNTVLIHVGDTSWLKTGKNVFVSDGANAGNFIVTAVNGSTSFTGEYLLLVGDGAAGLTVASGAIVMPGLGNFTVPFDLDSLSAFTDNTGGTKSDTIAASCVKQTIVLGPSTLSLVVSNQVWEVPVPFAFILNSFTFRPLKSVATTPVNVTFQSQVNALNTAGGSLVVNTAVASGATVAASAITGSNTGAAGQLVGVIAAVTTAFTEGIAQIECNVTNLDLSATLAAIAFKMNQLRTALRHG